ncbi:GDP-L-fucose synthase [Gemmobacter aquatilis]|uniref:GDP-L-fucose synthase n=1 Tax=Gemmobacter aquatilis TaxID=933059 RepID=A0A1H8NJC5_9RHOB|nr:NAD-dependent epimerase/dehydratase family protein [Gemmobacter aquatilis]SEO29710.1 GDP-L-fucose synthase [Gemmobacter aquatilis]
MYIVTGSTGMLGSAVVAKLQTSGISFLAPTRKDVDLMDPQATMEYFKETRPKVVLHTAAKVHGLMGNQKFPGDMFDENLRINFNVISAAKAVNVAKIVAAGTVAGYAAKFSEDIREDQYLDGEPHAAESSYGHAKRAMLAQLDSYYRQFDLPYAFAIYTNLYGPNDRFDTQYGHVVPSLVAKFHQAMRTGEPVRVWGTGKATRDFLYSADAARALLHLVDHGQGRFNIATARTVPIAYLVQLLSEISGVRNIIWETEKPEGQMMRSYNTERLADTGFQLKHSLEEGIAQTYAWYCENYPDVRCH